jgi:hypothetical protein
MDNVAARLPVAAPRGAAEGGLAGLAGQRVLARRLAPAVAVTMRPAVVAAAVVLGLIVFHLMVHQDEAGWVGKVGWPGTATLDGHLVEWEWVHVAETVDVVEGDREAPREIASQDLYRFAGAYLLALLREPLGGFYAGAVAAHLMAWVAAAWALYTLASLAGGSPRAGVLAAAFTATGPGFVGYLGQVDAHPFGYAAVAVFPALIERLRVFAAPRESGAHWLRPVCAGLALFVAAHTVEVGLPLLLFVWLFYGLDALIWDGGVRTRLLQLAALTGAFLVPYLGFQLFAEHALFARVQSFNDPGTRLRGALTALRDDGLLVWLARRTASITTRWGSAFPILVSGLAVFGAGVLPRRWLYWSATFLLVFCAAVALTKPATRDLYLAYPPVYVLAACGTERLTSWLVRLCAPTADPARRAWLHRLVLVGLVLAVVGVTNADLWGNYYLPTQWYQCKPNGC